MKTKQKTTGPEPEVFIGDGSTSPRMPRQTFSRRQGAGGRIVMIVGAGLLFTNLGACGRCMSVIEGASNQVVPKMDRHESSIATNVQIAGVDEADEVKVTPDFIVVNRFPQRRWGGGADPQKIEIVDRDSLDQLFTIEFPNQKNLHLYNVANSLFVIAESEFRENRNRSLTYTSVYRIDLNRNSTPEIVASRKVSGRLHSSRRHQNRMLLILESQSQSDASLLVATAPLVHASLQKSIAGAHAVSTVPDSLWQSDQWQGSQEGSWGYTGSSWCMGSLWKTELATSPRAQSTSPIRDSVADEIKIDEVRSFGISLIWVDLDSPQLRTTSYRSEFETDHVFVSDKSIVLAKTFDDSSLLQWILSNPTEMSFGEVRNSKILGRLKDSFSIAELFDSSRDKMFLAFATSSGQLWSRTNVAKNHLYIFDNEFQLASTVESFGIGEDIRAVRHIDNRLYVVTFRNTDPLFAFDVTQPGSPQLLGEIKIPGFSTYLHGLSSESIVGIGFDAIESSDRALTQGIQVSVFNVQNPEKMSRKDNHIFGGRGSSSEVTRNHKAFFMNASQSRMALPIIALGHHHLQGQLLPPLFSGALVFQISSSHTLHKNGLISHQSFIPRQCQEHMGQPRAWNEVALSFDVRRVFEDNGEVIALSAFGASRHPAGQVERINRSLAFVGSHDIIQRACPDLSWRPMWD